ncbi:heparinase II/III family protein [Elioraea thermophila]|uniref:heparinase II/III family protein n=1 Tax=Elioraea thermophila TaxID=2185104 RepID=UPI0018E5A5B2|nr:heparinase II/III family protein [Elioraea thermophila]
MAADFDPSRWLRSARRLLGRLPSVSATFARIPSQPALALRDPWPGDPTQGGRLLKGELAACGAVVPLLPEAWGTTWPPVVAEAAHGFAWLRDLRALGSDAARLRARALILGWLEAAPRLSPTAFGEAATGARLAAWLTHWDFVAASADEAFRQAMMARVWEDARDLAAALPAETMDRRAFTVLKGLVAAGAALPGGEAWLARALRFLGQEIERQILPDGGHVERSPEGLAAVLMDLIEIRGWLAAAKVAIPDSLAAAIARAAPMLAALRHGDGGLALFNGSREGSASLLSLLLAQTEARIRPATRSPAMRLERLAAGRTVLIVDAGPPPPRGQDRLSHAGTLSFELSVGRDRLIVNCGAAPAAPDAWRDALRATAAHSTLVIADVNSSELKPEGLGRRPEDVTLQRHEANGAHWLDATHDGWRKPFGAIHRRRLYLGDSGEDIRGEDAIEAPLPQPFAIRFHLHPSVTASLQQDGAGVLLRTPNSGGFVMRADGARLSLEESVYAGTDERRRTQQIVLSGGPEDGPCLVKWAITRAGAG